MAGVTYGQASNSSDSQLQVLVDASTSDPVAELLSLVGEEQWSEAADLLIALRDLKNQSLVALPGQQNRLPRTYSSYRRYMNSTINRLLADHRQLRKAWFDRIRFRLDGWNERDFDNAELAFQFAERFAHAPGIGVAVIQQTAQVSAEGGRLEEAVWLLTQLDPRFARFHVPFGDVLSPACVSVEEGEIPVSELAAQLVILESLRTSETADEHLEWFRREFGSSEGRLGNRQGNLAELLADILSNLNSSNDVQQNGTPDHSSTGWSIQTTNQPLAKSRFPPVDQLHTYPIVTDEKLIWRNGERIFVADTLTGQSAIANAVEQDSSSGEVLDAFTVWQNVRDSTWPDPSIGFNHYRMTADANHVFGVFDFGESNCIVGVDLKRQGKLLPGFPIYTADVQWQFEGPPMVAEGLLYTLARKYVAGSRQAESYVLCYALRSNESGGPLVPRWSTRVCLSRLPDVAGRSERDLRRLRRGGARLILDGKRILFCNDLGVVASVLATTGEIEWLVTYRREDVSSGDPSQSRLPQRRHGQLPLLFGNDLFVAPKDSSCVLSINKYSGKVNWKTRLPFCYQLLECSPTSLLLGGDQLVWLNPKSGQVAGRFPNELPNTLPGMRKSPGMGRGQGLVHGGLVYFPTAGAIHILERESGAIAGKPPLSVAVEYGPSFLGGHLTCENGMIVIADGQSIQAIPLNNLQNEWKRK